MSPCPRRLCARGLIVGTIFFFATPTSADVFRPGEWRGSLEGIFAFGRTDSGSDGSSATSQNLDLQERLTLRNVGAYFWSPRLVKLDLGGTFAFSQIWQRADSVTGSSDERRMGTLLGYDLSAFILPGNASSLQLFAVRDQNTPPRFGGGTQESLRENWGGKIFLGRLYIPSTLTLRRETREDKLIVGGVVARSDEADNILTYEGRRGGINSEMEIGYEFIDHTDEVSPGRDFQSHEGRLFYSLDFGPELDRRWDSRLRALTRAGEGGLDLTTMTLNESLRMAHTERLQTVYDYSLGYTSSRSADTLSNTGTFTLHHKLYESLTTTFAVNGRYETQSNGTNGRRGEIGGRLDFGYTKRLSGEGRLTAGLGGGFSYNHQNFDETVATAINELHAAAFPVAINIQMENPFVIESSVVVTKVANGPSIPGCSPFSVPRVLTEGVDYRLQTIGDITEIVPIPCTLVTPGISPGDTISVDYQFAVPSDLTFTTATFHANIAVDYGWIRIFGSHFQQNQTSLKGQDGDFLEDKRQETIGTELRYDKERFRASLKVEVELFDSDRNVFNALRLSQFLAYTILPEMTLRVTGIETMTVFSFPKERRTTTLAARADLDYRISPNWSARAFGAVQGLWQTGLESELTTEFGAQLELRFRKLEIGPTFRFLNRQRGDTDTKDYQALLRITRRF